MPSHHARMSPLLTFIVALGRLIVGSARWYLLAAVLAVSLSATPLTAAPQLGTRIPRTAPTITPLPSTYVQLPDLGPAQISGVIGDPTDPAAVTGLVFQITDAANVQANSDQPGKVTVTINPDSGDPPRWTLNIIPNATVYAANVTITATSASAESATYVISYSASPASARPATTRFHTGASDASAAIAIDDNRMWVGNDEDQVLRLYDRNKSGLALATLNVTDNLGLTDRDSEGALREVDIEGGARVGDRIYWIGSHSNSSEGKIRPNRFRLFATDVSADANTGAPSLTWVGYYDRLRTGAKGQPVGGDLIAWGDSKGYDFSASARQDNPPERLDGFNIEGLAIAPDGTTGYIGFRAPLVPVSNRHNALIAPLKNISALVDGTANAAEFDDPIELDLGGRGIRDIECNRNSECLIIAGSANDAGNFALYKWTGQRADAPTLVRDLSSFQPSDPALKGSFEAIVDMPDDLANATTVQLLMDNGDTQWYKDAGNSDPSKILPANFQKSRSERVGLNAAPPTLDKHIYLPLIQVSADRPTPPPPAGPPAQGARWKYLDDGSNQGAAWHEIAYDDSGWKEGQAILGYGDPGRQRTPINCGPDPACASNNYVTTYFRHAFTMTDPSTVKSLDLRLLRDDGAVVYLNGQEIFRSNMPAGSIAYDTLAAGVVNGDDETRFWQKTVSPAQLRAGVNVLAVEVHQASRSSSDVSFDLALTATAQGATRFAAIGDFGMGDVHETDVANRVASWDPDFVISLGDNNYPLGEQATIDAHIGKDYHQFIYPYSGSFGSGSPTNENRFWPSLGNHDWYTTGAAPYLAYFDLPGNERYYDFPKGNVHFFVVDSDPNEPDGTTVGSTQANWLHDRLAASNACWKVVYFHHAPYSSSSHGREDPDLKMRWPFQAWGASVVLSGHDHTYERLQVDGLTYFVNGLGGAGKYDFPNVVPGSQVRYNGDWGAMLIEADNQRMTLSFITQAGAVIDTYTLPGNCGS